VGLLGYEVDWMQGHAPAGTVRLAHSPIPNTSDNADMTVYTATSRATVFATGSIQFSWGLDDYQGKGRVSVAAQQMTCNFFTHALGPDMTPPLLSRRLRSVLQQWRSSSRSRSIPQRPRTVSTM
jgi:hypothetical protein